MTFDAVADWLGVESRVKSNARALCMRFLAKNVDFAYLDPEDIVRFIREFQRKESKRLLRQLDKL